jgi:hypothetical protein
MYLALALALAWLENSDSQGSLATLPLTTVSKRKEKSPSSMAKPKSVEPNVGLVTRSDSSGSNDRSAGSLAEAQTWRWPERLQLLFRWLKSQLLPRKISAGRSAAPFGKLVWQPAKDKSFTHP